MTTILDVAQASGVSVATVSRALRGLDRVSDATRAKVLATAAELHYVASPTAASLASGRTRAVGVITPFVNRWYFASLVSAIEKAIRPEAHHVMLLDLEDSASRRLTLTRDMVAKRVDGVIVLNIALSESEQDLLRQLKIPTVSIGARYGGWSSVTIQERHAVSVAVHHLIGLGHRDIAFVGAVLRPDVFGTVPLQRRDAFLEVMRSAGLPVRRSWIRLSDWTAREAATDATAMFSEGTRPTAVVAASDEIAIGVMAAAARAGLRVPEDVSVTGVDDQPLASVLGLSTVRQDVSALGVAAAGLLLGQLLGTGETQVESLAFPTDLILRDTTSGPRGAG